MPKIKKVDFHGERGEKYEGLISFSVLSSNHYVIFNHCFNVEQHTDQISAIINSLLALGVNVFQFKQAPKKTEHLYPLNTLSAVVAANQFLTKNYAPPAFIIGHGFNSVSTFLASAHLENIKGVIAIAACTPALLEKNTNVRKALLDNKQPFDFNKILNHFTKPLLMFHSLADTIIPISESSTFYHESKGAKSFITLEKSDHFLNDAEDIKYVARTIEIWVKQYINREEKKFLLESGQVVVCSHENLEQRIFTSLHQWVADEPVTNGGHDIGPDPYELLLSALGACTNMTLKIYANYKNIELGDVKTSLCYEKKRLSPDADNVSLVISRDIIIKNQSLSPDIVASLEKIANKCPIHKTLTGDVIIETKAYQDAEK